MEPHPTARGCLLLCKALGRHREGTNHFDSMGKGHERSLWEQEEAWVRAHCLTAPDAHGIAFALGTDCPEVRGTLSVTGNIPAAIPAPSQRLPLSFPLAWGQVFAAQTSYFQTAVTYPPQMHTALVLLFSALTS